MRDRKLSAGDTIDSHCTKCRAVYNHTIVAMVGERVVRVQCNTCGGIHNFRAAEEPKPVRVTASGAATRKTEPSQRKPKADPGALDREEWESLAPSFAAQQAVPYDMNGQFRANDLVKHPTFGVGIVKVIAGPQKMEVLFQTGKKLLRCK